jgi:predicted ABC-type ATPase
MFAGPNRSGETTVRREISRPFPPHFLGIVVDPDELEATIVREGTLDPEKFGVGAKDSEVR